MSLDKYKMTMTPRLKTMLNKFLYKHNNTNSHTWTKWMRIWNKMVMNWTKVNNRKYEHYKLNESYDNTSSTLSSYGRIFNNDNW